MRRKQLKNTPAYGSKMKTMKDDNTYALRRKVMDVLYWIKRDLGIEIPRIEVRIITDVQKNVAAYAYMGNNIIHIVDTTLKHNDDVIKHVVMHELLHAHLSIEHDPKCFLMRRKFPTDFDYTIEKSIKAFKGYYKM